MSFNPNYAGRQGNASHPCHVHQQSPVIQPGDLYPKGDVNHRRVNSPQTIVPMDDEEYQAYNRDYHSTISQQDMTQQLDVLGQGFDTQEASNAIQHPGIRYPEFSSQARMLLNPFKNDIGNVHQQADNYQGISPEAPMAFEQINESDIHPQPNTHCHQPFSPQEVMDLEPFNSQHNELYQQGVDMNSQTDTNGRQPNQAYEAYSPNAADLTKTEAAARESRIGKAEWLRRALDQPFDIDVMLSCNNVLLTTTANFPMAGLTNSYAKDQISRPVDTSRNLEHDWIMGTLKVNLIYLEARRRREQAVKENKG
ncbi:hypothetical protein N7519_010909 [Penicillium mononematosum]|uniref:uncharacterized protein n=1 Tax=Penicillium mononematosum TaxID=268346 RepID=UPI002548A661|nr:uncharacterized protein N7519_010909 [Penicillium mononematosum]KAJ6180448.1 hypothetical protein N7519_010909 [Penicillium mononematosum]